MMGRGGTKRHFAGGPGRTGNEQIDNPESQTPSSGPVLAQPQQAPESDPHSSDASESADSDSGSESHESSSSDEPDAPVRPKFISKSNRATQLNKQQPPVVAPEIDWHVSAIEDKTHTVDDTDGIDLKQEYAAWRARQQMREERDLKIMEQQQQEFEQKMDRLDSKRQRLAH